MCGRVEGAARAAAHYAVFFGVVAWKWQCCTADLDNKFPVIYMSNPVAIHVACTVAAGSPTVCSLQGFDEVDRTLQFFIQTLPVNGYLYETSQNFRTYGTDPKNAPVPIQEHQMPFQVSDALSRVVYVPPSDIFPPEGRWAAINYTVQEPISGQMSEPGIVSFNSPANHIAYSSFISGVDDWIVSGNIHSAVPTWQAFGWGLLSRYIYATDEVQYIDFETGSDKSKWYYEAPPGKFYLPELANAYGGILSFTVASTYGDFSYLNTPLDWITLECASCNSGRGLRIVRFADNGLEWDGTEKVVQVPLNVSNFWRRDPLNTALPFTDATACEIAAVLAGLTRIKILGDFTQAGEGVAIDDIAISSSAFQPSYPLECQQGCVCHHDQTAKRLACCGSSTSVYYPMTTLAHGAGHSPSGVSSGY
eukprot:gnl/TRDRNA2_/TRDRNA2_189944_c0_seq1.p1 gnl/TRDRNA2_/TRDRNA2_189944_c0~~gnl/TRDRNA2_/TRDRNA2_189944_c0_seq1.p1  ORF type:complete len:420 (+),score=55.67 gnl/TRDRNA2_/TRDRNA2_189944_c0_seq1:41-1300(+)